MKRYDIIKFNNGNGYSILKSDDRYYLYCLNININLDNSIKSKEDYLRNKKEVFITDSGVGYKFKEDGSFNLSGYGLKEIADDELCLLLME